MTYKPTTTLPVAVAFALWSTAAHADKFTDAVIERYQELGFDYIEVKEGVSQLKVEAIRGSQKYEVIYDRSTGRILKQETEAAEADEIGRSGVEIDTRRRDFIDSDDIDDEFDDEDDENDESDEEDDDEEDDDESDESDEDDENDEDDDEDSESDESDEADDDESDESDESDSDESDESDDGESGGSDSDEDDED